MAMQTRNIRAGARAGAQRVAPAALACLLAAGGAATLLTTVAAPAGAANPYRAGDAGIAVAVLPDGARGAAIARAGRLEATLEMPSATRWEASRLTDRFDGTTYDETTGYDASGNTVAVHRFDAQGRLTAVASLGWHTSKVTLKDGAAAARSATRLARLAGFDAAGTPTAAKTASGNGWRVAWQRAVDGIPVSGDGLRVELWPDGTLHAAVRTEHALAARPSTLIDSATAESAAVTQLGSSGAAGSAAVSGSELRWIAPNDAFSGSLPDAPSTELRLAWVVRASATGELVGEIRGVEVYVDAGSGAVIGGDVLR
jgi:hypothetical protein